MAQRPSIPSVQKYEPLNPFLWNIVCWEPSEEKISPFILIQSRYFWPVDFWVFFYYLLFPLLLLLSFSFLLYFPHFSLSFLSLYIRLFLSLLGLCYIAIAYVLIFTLITSLFLTPLALPNRHSLVPFFSFCSKTTRLSFTISSTTIWLITSYRFVILFYCFLPNYTVWLYTSWHVEFRLVNFLFALH